MKEIVTGGAEIGEVLSFVELKETIAVASSKAYVDGHFL